MPQQVTATETFERRQQFRLLQLRERLCSEKGQGRLASMQAQNTQTFHSLLYYRHLLIQSVWVTASQGHFDYSSSRLS